MNLQFIVDGLLTGSMIGLGAIGVTLTYSILRFSNFAHGDFMAWGTYATLTVVSAIGAIAGAVFVLARRQLTDITTVFLAAITILILMRFKKIQEPFIILVAALLGLLIKSCFQAG